MIINDYDQYRSQFIKYQFQHQFSEFNDKSVYLVRPKLHPFILVDDYMANQHVSEYIPAEILSKVYNREIILAFDISAESLRRHIDIIYDTLICKYSVPESQILVLNSSPDIYKKILSKSKETNKDPCLFEYFYFFDSMAHTMLMQELSRTYSSPLHNDRFTKKYINFNGQWRHHRVALIALLESKGLINSGYNSFTKSFNYGVGSPDFRYDLEKTKKFHIEKNGAVYHETLKIASVPTGIEGNLWFNACPDDTIDDLWAIWIDEVKDKFKDDSIHSLIDLGYDVYKKFPLKVDNTNYKRTHLHPFNSKLPLGSYMNLAHYYYKSYFSVVTETHFINEYCTFITEKILKPISFKHPFICLSTPYTLKHLRDRGYKTFSPYIDESYDEETDDTKRLLMVLKEIERLCNLDEKQLKDFRHGLIEIVDHNFNYLYDRQNFIRSIN